MSFCEKCEKIFSFVCKNLTLINVFTNYKTNFIFSHSHHFLCTCEVEIECSLLILTFSEFIKMTSFVVGFKTV